MHRAHTVHSPWVVGAYTAMFNVTTIVSLQNIQGLSPGLCIPSLLPREPTPRRSFEPTLPPGGLCLTQSGRLALPVLLPLSGGLNGFRGLRRSVQNQPWPGPVCRGSLAVPSESWVAGLLMPPRLGIAHGPRLQSLPGSHHPGAKPVRDHWSRVPAHPCSRDGVSANGVLSTRPLPMGSLQADDPSVSSTEALTVVLDSSGCC